MLHLAALIFSICIIEGRTGYATSKLNTSTLAGSYTDVNINGKNYLLNTYGFSLEDSVKFCHFKKMALISFDEPNEYSEWSAYIDSIGLGQITFWTSAWKSAGTSQWKWNSTNQIFDESMNFWRSGEPSTAPEGRACMTFSVGYEWEDWPERDCSNYRLIFDTICE